MDLLLLRFLERLIVVLIGGMAIYLGFRLFHEVPEHKDSSGKIVLPWNISIVMSRVGPGLFFALFGVIAVGLSLVRPLEIKSQAVNLGKTGTDYTTLRYAAGSKLDDWNQRADARALLRKDIAVLNTIPTLLRQDLPEHDRESIGHSIRQVKLKLMQPVWGSPEEEFGEFSEFEKWLQNGETDALPVNMAGALHLYRYGVSGAEQ